MKTQTFYRGGENKKAKLTKAEKVYNTLQAQRKALALRPKKEATV